MNNDADHIFYVLPGILYIFIGEMLIKSFAHFFELGHLFFFSSGARVVVAIFCIEVFKFSSATCPAPHDTWDLSSS